MGGEVQLNDVGEIIMGQSPPGSTYNESGVGLPFFQGVKDFNYRYPSIRVFCSEPSRIAWPGDILFSVRAPIGRINIVEVECAIGRGLSIIRAREQSDRRYIEFVLRSMERQWEIIEGGGSVFGNATRRDLETLTLPWPDDVLEREAIACILGALDDKIELNRKMNRTLEEMARAIFKSWFVDFDPVRAKDAVRRTHPGWTNEQVSRAACPNLKPEIAALFPDSFEDSELGEIPEGWKIGAVQDLGEVICGKTPPTTDRDNYGGDVPFVTIPDMHGKVFVTSTEKKLSEKGVETQKGKSLPPFSICVSCIATPGLVVLTSTQCQTNQQINSVIPSDSRTSIFCFFSLRELGERIRTHGAGGSVLLNLNKGLFSSMRILLPPREAYAFQNIAKSILEKVLNNEKEIEILAGIRDTLLPKLISGELRVKDAERIARRCV